MLQINKLQILNYTEGWNYNMFIFIQMKTVFLMFYQKNWIIFN